MSRSSSDLSVKPIRYEDFVPQNIENTIEDREQLPLFYRNTLYSTENVFIFSESDLAFDSNQNNGQSNILQSECKNYEYHLESVSAQADIILNRNAPQEEIYTQPEPLNDLFSQFKSYIKSTAFSQIVSNYLIAQGYKQTKKSGKHYNLNLEEKRAHAFFDKPADVLRLFDGVFDSE